MVRCETKTCSGTSGSIKPLWLAVLLAERFFAACSKHDRLKKNEKNVFCLDCIASICQHCISDHKSHHLLQIRRYVYHDVIRLHDIQKLLDCSRVQAYTINGARVVFLKERPQPKSNKGLAGNCEMCERSLQDAYRFCSVACKVDNSFGFGEEKGKEDEDTSTTTHETPPRHPPTTLDAPRHLPQLPAAAGERQQLPPPKLTAIPTHVLSSSSAHSHTTLLDTFMAASPLYYRAFLSKRHSSASSASLNLSTAPQRACLLSHRRRTPLLISDQRDPATLHLSSLLLKRIAGPSLHSVLLPAQFRRRKRSKPNRSPFS